MTQNAISKDLNRELARLARAIRARRIETRDLVRLHRTGVSAGDSADLRLTLSALDRTSADLARVLNMLPVNALDDTALSRVSPQLLSRIERRLTRLRKRLAPPPRPRPPERQKPSAPKHQADATFRCVDSYNHCRETGTNPAFWCQIALAVCLARALLRACPS